MEGDLQRILGRNIRLIRLTEGLSQEALAERLGCSRGYVSELELGKRNPTLQTIERLAEDLGESPLKLLSEQTATYKSVDR